MFSLVSPSTNTKSLGIAKRSSSFLIKEGCYIFLYRKRENHLMNPRKIYLYVKGNNLNDVISFLEIYEEFSIEKTFDHYIELSADISINLETLVNAREIVMGELFYDFIAFVMPLSFENMIQDVLDVMPDLNPGIYTIDSLIPEIVLQNKTELIRRLKNYYYNRFSPEIIDTILGFINQNLNVFDVAQGYEDAGVCGMSVLTDAKYFGGSLDDLIIARAAVDFPLLRKEFIIDEYQIIEARAYGADTILLIAAILTRKQI